MKLSEQLKRDHESGDFGKALAGYAERAALLEDAIVAMAEAGYLYYGQEGMSDAQKKCYAAYLMVKPPEHPSGDADGDGGKMDETFKSLGFKSEREFHRLVSAVDLSSPVNRDAFKHWQENDGTKEGLLKLPTTTKL